MCLGLEGPAKRGGGELDGRSAGWAEARACPDRQVCASRAAGGDGVVSEATWRLDIGRRQLGLPASQQGRAATARLALASARVPADLSQHRAAFTRPVRALAQGGQAQSREAVARI